MFLLFLTSDLFLSEKVEDPFISLCMYVYGICKSRWRTVCSGTECKISRWRSYAGKGMLMSKSASSVSPHLSISAHFPFPDRGWREEHLKGILGRPLPDPRHSVAVSLEVMPRGPGPLFWVSLVCLLAPLFTAGPAWCHASGHPGNPRSMMLLPNTKQDPVHYCQRLRSVGV